MDFQREREENDMRISDGNVLEWGDGVLFIRCGKEKRNTKSALGGDAASCVRVIQEEKGKSRFFIIFIFLLEERVKQMVS